MDLFDNIDDATAAFADNLEGKPKEEPNAAAEEVVETPSDTSEGEDTGDGEEGSQEASEGSDDASGNKEADPDDAEVEWEHTEGEQKQSLKATIRDLKASHLLREKSEQAQREYAERQQRAETVHNVAVTALNSTVARAKERLKPYEALDYVVLAQQMSSEDLTALRREHAQALNDATFYETELVKTVQAQRDAAQVEIRKAAEASVKELSDPKTGIPGWSPELYHKLIEHAVSYGLPRERVAQEVSPGVMRILHDAMQFRAGKAQAEAAVKRVVVKPKASPLKPGNSPGKTSATGRALQRLQKTGSVDDAAEAFAEQMRASAPASD